MMKKPLLFSALVALALGGFPAHAEYMFGIPGYSAPDGAPGVSGVTPQPTTINADGRAVTLDLHGSNGGPGGNAGDGTPASNCVQPYRIADNVYGASGGSGGNGGQGGMGGNGGDLTIYYNNVADLQKILVDDTPGQGGPGGQAGYGYQACQCSYYQWEIPQPPDCDGGGERRPQSDDDQGRRTVDQRPPVRPMPPRPVPPRPMPPQPPQPQPQPPHNGGQNWGQGGGDDHGGDHGGDDHNGGDHGGSGPVCYPRPDLIFSCQNGNPGNNGVPGNAGSNGNWGTIRLIKGAIPQTPVQPTAQLRVAALPASVVLTEDVWQTKTGLSALLDPRSRVPDTYIEYEGRRHVQVNVVWSAPAQAQQFSGDFVTLNLNSGVVTANLDSNGVWATTNVVYDAQGNATVTINQAVNPSDVTRLSATMTGTGRNVTILLKDGANLSDVVTTQVNAKEISHGIFGHSHFNDVVPAQLVSSTKSGVTVLIGQIQQIPSGDLNPNKDLEIDLKVMRIFGNHTAEQDFTLRQKLGQ